MQKITPHLWFDTQAKEAAELYCSLIPGSKITSVTALHDTPSGDANVVTFEFGGQSFMAISAGPYFKFNPSVSFHIKCATKEEVDAIWAKLSPGGKVRMELGAYPFSERYGWIEDKYGLSWQVIFAGAGAMKQRITPVLMYTGAVCGKAEEAVNFYASVFSARGGSASGGKATVLARYGEGEEPDQAGTVKYASFELLGQEFGAMDSARNHDFTFNETVSFVIHCGDQEEIDYYWGRLSADPKAEQCGWLKDKYGVSWQVTATVLGEMLQDKDPQKAERVTKAMLQMKKIDIEGLEKAYQG